MLAVLLATVLVPSGCMLWFMHAAMQNVSLATRQLLADAYGKDAEDAAAAVQTYCSAKADGLVAAADRSPAETFHRMVSSDVADAVIVRDSGGRLLYPSREPPAAAAIERPPAWQRAQAMEHEPDGAAQAAELYHWITANAAHIDQQAQATLAEARCLAKAGQRDRAVALLVELAGSEDLRAARGDQGRLVTPGAALFAMQLIARTDDERFRALAADLRARLNDYGEPAMQPSQRRFLMGALAELDPSAAPLATRDAEALAADYLSQPQPAARPARMSPTSLPGVWQIAGPGGEIVGLFNHQRLLADLAAAVEGEQATDMHLGAYPPGQGDASAFLSIPAGEALPGWTLQVRLIGDDPFAAAAQRRKAVYLYTAAAGIALVAALAVGLTYHVSRQVRLTRLKNDLIATVSHELKTPLASMRLLIDTLLERRYGGQQQADEYLTLIAKENERLTRLIDNFLNFSRMERNRRAFVFGELTAAELVDAVVRALPDRITQPPCEFTVEVADDCPSVFGDRDGLTTVLLNLLDNAYKYSKAPRHITLRALPRDGRLCLAVSDNGIGLSRGAQRRVFHRFYQVDSSLSRSVGGCGLGLSIVKFVVDAHGGMVGVSSRPGQGSTFTVLLPGIPAGDERQADDND